MPVATFQRSHLTHVVGKPLGMDELAKSLPLLGGEVDHVSGDTIAMEYFPNRPDLLVVEGAARALRSYLGLKPGLSTYPVAPAKAQLRVDASVQTMRPYAGLCFVRGVPVDDAYVAALVDAQEKLCLSMGRKRKKVAIGLHDASGISGPFTYTAAGPNEHAFVPLGDTRKQTPAEIVANHPKGQAYGGLLDGKHYPVFLDNDGQVLSMPPIINAARTAVTGKTRDILVDVTGTDAPSVRATLALLATCLAERGGRIEAVDVVDASGTWTCPQLAPAERIIHMDDVENLLGPVDSEAAARALRKMGHDCDAYDTKLHVKSPAWRFDLMHDVDWIEDIAVGIGYDAFTPRLSQAQTVGGKLATQAIEDACRLCLVGQGWNEATTLTLTGTFQQATAWGDKPKPSVQLANPVLAQTTELRRRIVPSLLEVLAANRHRSLPQRLFEVGYVVDPIDNAWQNRLRVAGVECSARAGWSTVAGLLGVLGRDVGIAWQLVAKDLPGYVPGRAVVILQDGKQVGEAGELHPDTLVAFELSAPVVAFEIALE